MSDSNMQGGSVDELLDVSVERPVLEQLKVEVGRTLKDRVEPGLTGDDREERQLDAVDEAGGHQRPVQRQAAVRAQRHLRLLLEPGDDVDGVPAHRSEEHTSELQSHSDLVCRLLLEKKKKKKFSFFLLNKKKKTIKPQSR